MTNLHDPERSSRASEGGDELLGVSLDTTSICNLRCKICSLEDFYAGKGVLSFETFRRLGDALGRLKHLALSSNAEPLLNPRLEDMLEFAKAKSQGRIVTSFTTNATLLEERRLKLLIERGLDALEVSMDGATKATFEKMRVGASFEQVVDNVARIESTKRELQSATPHVSIRFTLCEDNRDELIAMLALARHLHVEHLVVNGLEAYDAKMAQQALYGEHDDARMVELFEEVEQRAAEWGMRVDLPRLSPEPIDDCHLIDHSCIILWDGTVVPCSPLAYPRPFHYFGAALEHPRISFGNIREHALHEIWRSPEYVAWRERLHGGEVFDYCKPCLKRAGVICPLKHWKWLSTPPATSSSPAPPPAARGASLWDRARAALTRTGLRRASSRRAERTA